MFNRKRAITLAALSAVVLVLVVLIATMAWRGHKKKAEDERLAGVVAEATQELRQALAAPPPGTSVAKFEEWLQSAKASPNPALGSAAEHYLLGAREIARRRADSERFARQAAASRQALAAHMGRSAGRGPGWIHQAADLKKKVEADHNDLARSLKTLDDLLAGLPEAEKRLQGQVAPGALIEAKEIDAARARAQDAAKRAAAELEQVRRLTP